MTAEEHPEVTEQEEPDRRWVRPRFRVRVLGFLAVLLLGATAAGLLVQRTVLLRRLDAQVDRLLLQERSELESLATGRNPATGEPFGDDAQAIFETFLRRNRPDRSEAFVSFVDGMPYERTRFPGDADDLPELYDLWSGLTEGRRGEVSSAAGPVRYLAVPLADGGDTRGVFVVLNFMAQDRARIDDDLRVQALVVGGVVLVALAIAWVTMGRLLRPLRDVTDAARTISDSDLSLRIPVDADDEVGELARTFNQMLDRLEEAFATQRAFVDDAGHELRTPITVILGQLELMGDDPDERSRTLAVVDDELRRMARIVEDLLLLAKAEQPDFVCVEPVELSDHTTEVLMKARTLGDRGWRLDACAEGIVHVDPQRLTQALLNLARNAVEHTEEGTEVGIGSALDGERVRFWVRDAGDGIAVEDQARLFERFARGRHARRRSDGAGLGLAIVAAVAVGHGGTVTVQSRPGHGARFELVLPVDAPSSPPARPEGPGTPESRGADRPAPLSWSPPPGADATTEVAVGATEPRPGPDDPTTEQSVPDGPGPDPDVDPEPTRSTRWPGS